ncbi:MULTISPECIES: MmpS family transport accessory protein [Amycolatopsis]|uniref:MmpS family membrane protein n=1 Tax=Amycolatopsis tucumanensis TaxID=401106 RepID=A0ABP7IR66_9PSEU|nr:MmpS family transport accessory protein [Amycolatopsis tucumanensis]MCF6426582.1 MmpS family protein [Amycolatopsis tucumanensis]MCF6428863.1 MmpS family protein [Amycolatopsis tucumanensis]
MGVVPTAGPGPGPRRPLASSMAVFAALGVVLTVGLTSLLVAGQRSADPSVGSLSGASAPVVAPVAPVPQVSYAVTYELTGGAGALNVTYVAKGADIAQVLETDTPWSVSIERTGPQGSDQYFSLTAQNAGGGTLTCRIIVDGVVVSERSVSAPQGMVRCSKSLP